MTIATKQIPPDLLFAALADATRLRILTLLVEQEMCVADLVEVLDVPQPTASRHLAYLRRRGLVETRKQGSWIFYALPKPANGFQRKVRKSIKASRKHIPLAREDAIRLSRLQERGGCCPAIPEPVL